MQMALMLLISALVVFTMLGSSYFLREEQPLRSGCRRLPYEDAEF